MNLLKKLFGSKTRSEWEEAKKSGDVYPADSFTLFTFNYPNGDVGTGWANAAYREYRYKRQCPYNLRIMVHLPDDIGETNPELDMGAVEDYFSEMLQGLGVAHLAARMATETGLNLEFYLEQREPATAQLKQLSEDPQRLVSFTFTVIRDPLWIGVSGLMRDGEIDGQ